MTSLTRESVCDYCKLPLPGSWRLRPPSALEEQAPLYCCLGCRVAAAIAEEKGEHGVPRAMLMRLGLSIFFTMNVMAFTMALWTTDVYGQTAAPSTLSLTLSGLFRYLVLLFALPVIFLLGLPLFEHARTSLRQGVFSTDWLLASGVAASFGFSFLSVLRGHGPIYFEVGCFILVMTTLGRWLEVTGKLKASAALDALARLLPDRVRRIKDGQEQSVPLDEIRIDDLLRVLPGERFPADGRVESHAGLVDEQVLTGESRPVLKERGDRISGWYAQPRRRSEGYRHRDRRARNARPRRRTGPAGTRIEGTISAPRRPGRQPVRPVCISGCHRHIRRSLGARLDRTGILVCPGSRLDCLSLRAGPGGTACGMDRTRSRRVGASALSKR